MVGDERQLTDSRRAARTLRDHRGVKPEAGLAHPHVREGLGDYAIVAIERMNFQIAGLTQMLAKVVVRARGLPGSGQDAEVPAGASSRRHTYFLTWLPPLLDLPHLSGQVDRFAREEEAEQDL